MASDLTIPETHDTAAWVAALKLIDTDEPVIGGIDGISNAQAIQLAKRTTWLRAVITAVVDAAEVDSDPANLDQLLDAITAIVETNMPEGDTSLKPGDLVITTKRTAPDGTVKANGAALSIASYGALAAAIYCGDALNALAPWGYRCTDPNNPTTTRAVAGTHIVLPDLRGEHIRGWDDGRGVDVQSITGTTTNGSTAITAIADTQTLYIGQSITGTGIPAGATITAITSGTAITISVAATATAAGVALTCIGRAFGSWQRDAIRNITGALSPVHASSAGGVASGALGKIAGGSDTGTTNQGEARLGIDFDASRVVPTALENRVRNVALLICIKY